MTTRVLSSLARWRALLGLLWGSARWRVVVFAALAVAAGLLPSLAILTTGALVAAIPGAVEHGLTSAQGRPALLALSALVLLLATAEVCSAAMVQVSRTINTLFTLEIYRVLARVSLGTPGVAILEDPALADELQRIRDADRRGVLWQTTTRMGSVIVSRISGIGPLVVLLGFRWWAPLLLFAGWHLANLVFVKATERGVHVDVSEGAVRQRRAEYLRSLVLEPTAAKENRVFGLGGWMVGRYADAWQDALHLMWRNRGAQRGLSLAAAAVLIVAHAAVLGAL
ncbi:MAG TPA: hypothetical protein VHG93_14615, partial [Longimicrobium sp.]|nr:hypothetical protein [Longimicrobium sp.]